MRRNDRFFLFLRASFFTEEEEEKDGAKKKSTFPLSRYVGKEKDDQEKKEG